TSIRERIQSYQNKDKKQENHSELLKFKDSSDEISAPPDPLEKAGPTHEEEVNSGCKKEIPINFQEYLELIDWTGRSVLSGKKGSIPPNLSPILKRLEIKEEGWLKTATHFEKYFFRAAGRLDHLQALGKKLGLHWMKGVSGSQTLYCSHQGKKVA
ncbi:MAG: hypothetical protein GY786_16295, partial [Proteobacteria bacterium]|nr:hypothetical protein [Pseudomonadota bacterium]